MNEDELKLCLYQISLSEMILFMLSKDLKSYEKLRKTCQESTDEMVDKINEKIKEEKINEKNTD